MFDKKETDDQNDNNYYFNDSRGKLHPHIIIPKKRGTYKHILLINANPASQIFIAQQFRNYVPGIDLQQTNSSLGNPVAFWTIAETYLLSMAAA